MGYVITLQCVCVLVWDGDMWIMQWLFNCNVFNTPWISYVGKWVSEWCVSAWARECVRECVREYVNACLSIRECQCVWACAWVCVCVCVSVRASVCARASVFVSVCECVSVLSPFYNYERLSVFCSISDVDCTPQIYAISVTLCLKGKILILLTPIRSN